MLEADLAAFRAALLREDHTLKRRLADRALSRLLEADWPRTHEELEEGRAGR